MCPVEKAGKIAIPTSAQYEIRDRLRIVHIRKRNDDRVAVLDWLGEGQDPASRVDHVLKAVIADQASKRSAD